MHKSVATSLVEWAETQLERSGAAADYLIRKRGLTLTIIHKARLGFIPPVLTAGLPSVMNSIGWLVSTNRIVFPTILNGQVVMVTSRLIENGDYKHIHLLVNSKETPYGLVSQPVLSNTLIIVESPICALTLQQCQYNAVAIYGVNWATAMLPYFKSLTPHVNRFILLADNDKNKAGVTGFTKFGGLLAREVAPIATVGLAIMPELDGLMKVDANDYWMAQPETFKAVIDTLITTPNIDLNVLPTEAPPTPKYSEPTRPIDMETIPQKIRAAVDIFETCKVLGITCHGSGERLAAICPVHADTNPSMTIYPQTNTFYCWSCGKGGDVINLVEFVLGCDFRTAIQWFQTNFRITGLS